ncbi:MAG: hypothetical protein NTAFB01_08060 [Nitrospira sp.]
MKNHRAEPTIPTRGHRDSNSHRQYFPIICNPVYMKRGFHTQRHKESFRAKNPTLFLEMYNPQKWPYHGAIWSGILGKTADRA